jgi:hypothetical protein
MASTYRGDRATQDASAIPSASPTQPASCADTEPGAASVHHRERPRSAKKQPYGRGKDHHLGAAQMSRCGTPRQTRYRTTLRPTNILQGFTHRLLIAEVVILLIRLLSSGSSAVRRTAWTSIGPSELSGTANGAVSIKTASGRERPVRHCPRMWRHTGGNSISPARSSISSIPRQTMSRSAPLA